jgi:dGTP triphosphohydrolase
MLTEEQIREAGKQYAKINPHHEEGESEVDPTVQDSQGYSGSVLSAMAANLEENKRKAMDLMEDLANQGYTAINSDSLKHMKDVLGEDVIEEFWKNKTSMLPEHFDLINISNKSRAHTIAQLIVYAELMKSIQASNQASYEKALEIMAEQSDLIRKAMYQDGRQIQEEITKERKNLESVILQSAKIQNEIAATQAKTLKLIEGRIDTYMEENMESLATTMAGKIANGVYKAKLKDIQLKSKLCFSILAGAFLAVGFVLGKLI